MKKLIKRLFSAILLAMVVVPKSQAAPSKTATPIVQSESSRAESKAIDGDVEPKTIGNDKPGYEHRIHHYNGTVNPPPPQEYKDAVIEILKYMEDTFHFIEIADKDELLATDVLDQSWYQWLSYLRQMTPLTNKMTVHANDIENPNHDAPNNIWDSLVDFFLKDVNVNSKDDKNDIDVQFTTVKFDPVGQLLRAGLNMLGEYSGMNDIYTWWRTFMTRLSKYSAADLVRAESSTEPEDTDLIMTIADYDPVVLGVNTILFLGYQALFWGIFLPKAGIENLFADYPDINPDYYDDGDASDDVPPEEDPDNIDPDYEDARIDHGYSSYYHYEDDYFYNGNRRQAENHGQADAQRRKTEDPLARDPYTYQVGQYPLSDPNAFIKKK